MKGLGVDRHLLGLKIAAKELGIKVPLLYADPSFTRSSHMRISTSQVLIFFDFLFGIRITRFHFSGRLEMRRVHVLWAIGKRWLRVLL